MNKKEKNKIVVLLDSHAILHRAYHALPDFSSSKGEPTGGLYGLAAMLIKIISELKPDYIIACYDLAAPTYRHEAYAEYKGKRKKADDALVAQMDRSRDIFTAFSIPMYDKAGFEADDMLGTIVEQLIKKPARTERGSARSGGDIDVVIASGDMDTLQLVVDKKVQVYTLKKGIKDTILYDEEGVKERFGFGPELLPDFKGLRGDPSDNIIGIAGIGEKTATDLIKNFGTIEEMYKKLKKDPETFLKAGIKPRIIELLKNGEEEATFSKMLATIRRDAPIGFTLPEKEWRDTVQIQDVKNLFNDLEFRTLGSRVEVLLGGKEEFDKKIEVKSGDEAPLSEVIDQTELEKTRIALWLINSNITNPTLEDIFQFAHTENFKEAQITIFAEIKKRELEFVFNEIEVPLIPIVHKMEERGVRVDKERLAELSKEYHKVLKGLEKKIWKESGGEEFNINSPKQLGEVLFVKMGLVLKNQKKTSTGAKSTKESELEKMRELHPIIDSILEYREYQKLLSTYIDSIPEQLSTDSRLHAHFEQAGSTTGRMSSRDPNLQNIPIKTDLGKAIRGAFIASDDHVLLSFDYSQIELRIAAFLSGDEKLIKIFKDGEDVHAAVASEVFNVPQNEVTHEMRRKAKVINFGILYGMGINALRANLGTDRAEAQEFYNRYFETFSTLAHYLDTTKAEAARKGYTLTFFGRRRYFEGINSSLPYIRAQAERMAINAPMQGTQSDIIKLAMKKIDEYLVEEKLDNKVHLLLQVHDELIFEAESGVAKKVAPKIKEIMENIMDKKDTEGVPIKANSYIGERWSDMKLL